MILRRRHLDELRQRRAAERRGTLAAQLADQPRQVGRDEGAAMVDRGAARHGARDDSAPAPRPPGCAP